MAPRRRTQRTPRRLFWTSVMLVAAAEGWFWWHAHPPRETEPNARRPAPEVAAALPGAALQTPAAAPGDEAQRSPEPEPGAEALAVPRLDLAPLRQSDSQFRALARDLSGHALVREGLAQPDLIHTLVGATLEICEGRNPAHRFGFLRPEAPFAIRGAPQSPRIAPESYRRYDAAVDAFSGLDPVETLRLYREFEPRFDEAYAGLGYPGADFDDALGCALARLLETPIVDEDVRLRPRALRYEYAVADLQALDPIQRQLLRSGPRNVARVLAKLQELQQAWRVPVRVEDPALEGPSHQAPQ